MKKPLLKPLALVSLLALLNVPVTVPAGQGAVGMLYTVPNNTFIENKSGDSVVTLNDTSGSISTLQASINNARSANPNSIIVIHLLRGATYTVSSAGLVLGSHECLVGTGAKIQAAGATVTVPLIQIASNSINVSVAGGLLDGNGAPINGITAPAASRVNIDKVTVIDCGLDGILLHGHGNSTYDNEMTVTRCDVSGSPAHAGISIQSATQAAILENHCHDNAVGILVNCAWADVAGNTCRGNTTGIDVAGGNDNVIANNTCDNNATGIHVAGSKHMVVSDSLGGNSTAGISSTGSNNYFMDNLFTAGNAAAFSGAGSSDTVVAYKGPLAAPGQNYFYPPLIDDQHTATIVNGMGRTDLTISSTSIDSVQSQYNTARSANPDDVIVLHLNGTFTVGATSLTLESNTCVLLNGTIQINSSTGASAAVKGGNSPNNVCFSGGTIDGGNLTGNNGISVSSGACIQVDAVKLQHFGNSANRSGGSDIIHFSGGSTPYIVTRCLLNGGAARGIWLQLSGQKSLISDNEVTDVNQDGVDCDSSTFASVVKFNYCHDLVRYGVFFEQSASHNLALGNVCNNTGRDINLYNNFSTPRGPTQYNSVLCNWCLGSNGLRNGSTGDTTNVVTSHNFIFNNVVTSASISSELYGSENYYSQNYQSGGSLSTAGVEKFFNSPDVDGNLQIRDSNSGLSIVVQGAATTNNASIVTATPSSLGNGSSNDEWKFVPTDSGFYRVVNKNSGLSMVVQGASTANGAPIVQATYSKDTTYNDEWMILSAGNGLYNFANRRSDLNLDVTGGSQIPGTALEQWPANGGANQAFSLIEDSVPTVSADFSLVASPGSQTITSGDSTSFTATVTPTNGFTGTVTFSVSGLPAGATGSFSPASVNGSGSSTLTVTTSASTPGGSYTLTVTGTSGSLVHSDTVTLAVSDFTVAATPPSQAAPVGSSVAYTVNLGNINSFGGNISLNASGLPTGASASFSPASLTAPGTSTMTVTTSGSTPAANSTLTITGTSGSLAHSTNVTLKVTDFALSASPTSQAVAAGSSTTYTLSVNALNGFTGTVTFGSVSGLPAGATATFTPGSVNGSGTATLTVNTTGSTPAGTTTLTISASSGTLTHTLPVTLNVTDFSVTATPASQTVTAGGSTTYTATAGAINGFGGTITWSVTGLPTGATGGFSPASVTGSGSSTLTVNTTGSAPAGTNTLTVTGTSGSLSHSTTVKLVVNGAVTNTLPAGWSHADIGAVGIAGNATFSGGTFTVSGSGSDIWTAADQFHYAWQSVTNDLTITARVAAENGTGSFAKAGVMIRETTATNAIEVSVLLTPTNGVAMEVRSATGASSVNVTGWIKGPVPPTWVRLVRSGNTFTSYRSSDGIAWTLMATTNVTMAATAKAGLAVTSHDNASLNAAAFDNVTFSRITFADRDIGAVGLAGSATYSAGVYTVKGSGADIYGTGDQFNYDSQLVSGDATITARVATLASTNAWSKSGLMFRETLATNAAYVGLYLTVSNGVSMQFRGATGIGAVDLARQTGLKAPYWIRLNRTGNTFTGYSSPDGVTWTQVGSTNVTTVAGANIGLAVTAHDNTKLNTSTFDRLDIQ